MSRAMTFREFADVVNYISAHHSPHVGGKLTIKYIDPHFDLRDSTVFSVTFRTMGGRELWFHVMNECRDLPESLYDRIMAWLKREES